MFPNFNDNNFDKHFEQFEQLIKKTFGIAIAAWIISEMRLKYEQQKLDILNHGNKTN